MGPRDQLVDPLAGRLDVREYAEPSEDTLARRLEQHACAHGADRGRALEEGDPVAGAPEQRRDGSSGDAEADDRDSTPAHRSGVFQPRPRLHSGTWR